MQTIDGTASRAADLRAELRTLAPPKRPAVAPGTSFADLAAEQEALAAKLTVEAARLVRLLQQIGAWQPAFGGQMKRG